MRLLAAPLLTCLACVGDPHSSDADACTVPGWDCEALECGPESAHTVECSRPGDLPEPEPATTPCVTSEDCRTDVPYDEYFEVYCVGGVCRNIRPGTVTLCLSAAYWEGETLDSLPPVLSVEGEFYAPYLPTIKSVVFPRKVSDPGCAATWDACVSLPAEEADQGFILANVFTESEGAPELVGEYWEPVYLGYADEGCQWTSPQEYSYAPFKGDISVWFSLWFEHVPQAE